LAWRLRAVMGPCPTCPGLRHAELLLAWCALTREKPGCGCLAGVADAARRVGWLVGSPVGCSP
jgi:hypothetical protein